jgi:hypothetical protein
MPFDPVVNGEAARISRLDVKAATCSSEAPASARCVLASFDNASMARVVAFTFVRQGSQWELQDVDAREPRDSVWTLSKLVGGAKGGP